MNDKVSKEILVSVKLNSKDLLKFKYGQYYGSLGGKIATSFGTFFLFILVFDLISNFGEMGARFFVSYLPTIVLAAITLVIIPVIMIFQTQISMINDPFLMKEQKYRFVDTGFSVSSDCSNLNIRWDEVYRIISSKHNLAIFISKNKAFIIPKRLFHENNQLLEELKQVFITNITPKKLKIK